MLLNLRIHAQSQEGKERVRTGEIIPSGNLLLDHGKAQTTLVVLMFQKPLGSQKPLVGERACFAESESSG
jgi:hypothetical protein